MRRFERTADSCTHRALKCSGDDTLSISCWAQSLVSVRCQCEHVRMSCGIKLSACCVPLSITTPPPCRERHLQALGSEPLAVPAPAPKRRKTAAAAAKATASVPALHAVSAPAAAARAAEEGVAVSSEDSPAEEEDRQSSPVSNVGRSVVHDRPEDKPLLPADDPTRHDAALATQLDAELHQAAHPAKGGNKLLNAALKQTTIS